METTGSERGPSGDARVGLVPLGEERQLWSLGGPRNSPGSAVRVAVREFRRRYGQRADREDLIQEASLAVLEALPKARSWGYLVNAARWRLSERFLRRPAHEREVLAALRTVIDLGQWGGTRDVTHQPQNRPRSALSRKERDSLRHFRTRTMRLILTQLRDA